MRLCSLCIIIFILIGQEYAILDVNFLHWQSCISILIIYLSCLSVLSCGLLLIICAFLCIGFKQSFQLGYNPFSLLFPLNILSVMFSFEVQLKLYTLDMALLLFLV